MWIVGYFSFFTLSFTESDSTGEKRKDYDGEDDGEEEIFPSLHRNITSNVKRSYQFFHLMYQVFLIFIILVTSFFQHFLPSLFAAFFFEAL